MQGNLSEQLTVDDMARAALFSKFHFSRIFQRVTGISPGRFLSALRLQHAKKLLTSTSLSVADVSLRVGYASVGTFSSRFTRSVGLSPTTYRRLGGFTPFVPVEDSDSVLSRPTGAIRGKVAAESGHPMGRIFIGVFPQRIPEGRPVQCCILDGAGEFVLDPVPSGVWHLLAHSVAAESEDNPNGDMTFVSSYGPLLMQRDSVLDVELPLKPMRIVDPPVLLALLDVRRSALEREREQQSMAAGRR
ncbi:helix-turn-helix transcriptional regulator [Micromonospora sp. WMMD882]|uniref:helix-turn-helix domain-containing protein n=1 Tax=Micromonospora sp. WMMD882 TaxID=3015151 RepID=UPI00248B4415|nr:helix-turn-helix transcriptional regulator [Micromonospora sp. WMMD882]WBB82280.1 helix-turn-helix transcriptional regulator [Micromonospora sp. WMMD882]